MRSPGVPVGDIDFATTAPPEVVAARAAEAGLKAVPTGIEHGTLTLVADGVGYEVTTLREDVETDGRRAVVRFGRDWEADAQRRDFTVNALSVDAAGVVHDPARRLSRHRSPAASASSATPTSGSPRTGSASSASSASTPSSATGAYDPDGLAAAIRARDGLARTVGGADRPGDAPADPRAARRRSDRAHAGLRHPAGRPRRRRLSRPARAPPRLRAGGRRRRRRSRSALPRRAAGSRRTRSGSATGFGSTNAERDLMRAAVGAARRTPLPGDDKAARRFLYDLGEEAFRGAVALAFAWSGGAADEAAYAELYRLPERWQPPRFPLGGRDALGAGAVARPGGRGASSRASRRGGSTRISCPTTAALRSRLQQMIAAAQ